MENKWKTPGWRGLLKNQPGSFLAFLPSGDTQMFSFLHSGLKH
jgi:hypothetical protein